MSKQPEYWRKYGPPVNVHWLIRKTRKNIIRWISIDNELPISMRALILKRNSLVKNNFTSNYDDGEFSNYFNNYHTTLEKRQLKSVINCPKKKKKKFLPNKMQNDLTVMIPLNNSNWQIAVRKLKKIFMPRAVPWN